MILLLNTVLLIGTGNYNQALWGGGGGGGGEGGFYRGEWAKHDTT